MTDLKLPSGGIYTHNLLICSSLKFTYLLKLFVKVIYLLKLNKIENCGQC